MQYGEIVQLGRHRLMCGDATKYEDIEQLLGSDRVNLVLTDPPYGISFLGNKPRAIGGSTLKHMPVLNDNDNTAFKNNYRHIRKLTDRMIIWGGQNFSEVLPPSYGWLFWDKLKNTDKLSFGDGELAWTTVSTKVKKYTFKWNGAHGRDKELDGFLHPTQKPVELHAQILNDFSQPDDVILDCFGGSGTTLIACEITGRTCLMMEISPEYCGIITQRYEKLADCSPQA